MTAPSHLAGASPPVAFLTALAQSLSTMALYGPRHPMRARSIQACLDRLRRLQESEAQPSFSFLDRDVIYGTQPLHELRQWQWAMRFSAAGVQRLEFDGRVEVDELERVLEQVMSRLASHGDDARPDGGEGSVRFGAVGLRSEQRATPDAPGAGAATAIPMRDEVEAMRWIWRHAVEQHAVDGSAARLLVRSLLSLSARDGATLIPVVTLTGFEHYPVAHALNVASLAGALAEVSDTGGVSVEAAMSAGLLHDIGMAALPPELTAGNRLSPGDRARVEEHARLGSRMILATAPALEAAAVAAYEHHLRPDGRGYPATGAPRPPHTVSQLVRVCSVYSALTTSRFHWPAWERDRALAYLEERAGAEYEPRLTAAFASLLRAPDTVLVSVAEGTG